MQVALKPTLQLHFSPKPPASCAPGTREPTPCAHSEADRIRPPRVRPPEAARVGPSRLSPQRI